MAGYSGTPLPKKLGIRAATRVALLGAPDAFEAVLELMPDGVVTDVTESVVRSIGLSSGLVDNKVCAIDETWSGLRFVVRLEDRPAKR